MTVLLVVAAAVIVTYALLLGALVVAHRRWDVRALARLVPHCVGLFKRAFRDPRVPVGWKLAAGFAVLYLAIPFDLIPDFLPLVGQLDDALLVALVLRGLLRSATRP